MSDQRLVRVRSINTAVVRTEPDLTPIAVMQITTPSGDYRRFMLTEKQVDELASMFVNLSCDMVTA